MAGRDGQGAVSGRRAYGAEEPPMDLGQVRKYPRRRERLAEHPAHPAPTVVLVHGGIQGPSIWTDTVEELERHGLRALTVDLPSMRDRDAGLRDDARAVRDLLDGLDEVVLCGHWYAGMVITEAAAGPHRAVRHLVYLAAPIPDTGDSLAGLAEGNPVAAGAIARLNDENPLVGVQPVQGSAWRSIPYTYVRIADDPLPELIAEAAAGHLHETVTLPTARRRAEILARLARQVQNR